ncbi:type II secretion system F family protein [Micromonospora sp. NPDC049900]|uniref:type II secretion system F family protein n=1 Tax=Micromonospora sp. NPDC049900 TaxID=3364275 RepID=UPI003797C4FF
MILDLTAILAGLLAIGGVVVGIVGVVGTTRPPRPPSALAARLLDLWTGAGRTRREQRSHQYKIVAGVGGGAIAWLLSGWPAAGLIVGVALPGIPWLFSAASIEQKALSRLKGVEFWTRRLADIVAQGIGLQQAIVATVATAPSAIEQEVRDLAARIQANVEPATALQQFADEVDDYTCDQVIAPLMLHLRDRGQGLHEVLAAISRSIAAEIDMRSTIDAKRAGPRFAVRFLSGMTLALIIYGAFNPDYLRPYSTPLGQLVLLGLAGLYVLLMVLVRRLSLPPPRPRLLPPTGAQQTEALA